MATSDNNQFADITMARDNFENVPQHELPSGYKFRTYRPGDKKHWVDLHIAGEPFVAATDELFDEQFGDGLDVLDERMFFVITTDGDPVGTITAWWEEKRDRLYERGRIHWVVVHPDHQGKGIAKAMMTRAMERLRKSHDRAMLGTSEGRPVAVKIYLDFGFLPDDHEGDDPQIVEAWRRINLKLNHPALTEYLSQIDSV